MRGHLLERGSELAALAAAARDAGSGAGSVVLVHGEAGIGKSSLLAAFRAPRMRVLAGWCDALSTPRTLGPFRELAGSVGASLTRALAGGDRDEVLGALHDELATGGPTMLVVEDVHWADEATLDTLRFLVRRIEQLPAVLVLTYRDDELTQDHPLRQLLGEAARAEPVRRLALARLSPAAVEELTTPTGLDAAEVYAQTGGNPYFVSELLASAESGAAESGAAESGAARAARRPRTKAAPSRVPRTVVDAVLGRLRRLDRKVQRVVERLAVLPSGVDRRLVEKLAPGGFAALAAAEERGLVTVSPSRVTFRHELTRRAVVDALPVVRRAELNARALAALREVESPEPARLLHHAVEAGDVEAIVDYAPVAARDASASGAHREATAHFAQALAHADTYPPEERAALLEEQAIELYTLGRAPEAVDTQASAVTQRRVLGEPRALGASLRWLSRMHWFAGRRRPAEKAAREATVVLEPTGDPALLALALSNESQLAMLAHETTTSARLAHRVIPLARELDDAPLLSHALTNLGLATFMAGDAGGLARIEEAVRVALSVDDVEDACRAYVGLTWCLLDVYRLDEAERHLAEGIALAQSSEFIGFLSHLEIERGRLELARAHWPAALASSERGLHTQLPARCSALTVVATVGVRLGRPDAVETMAEAQALAEEIGEIQRLGRLAALRAEEALLRDDRAAARDAARPAYDEAVRLGDLPLQAELAYRLRQAGHRVAVPTVDLAFARQARGDGLGAARAWEQAGCPYHRAEALADSGRPDALLTALGILDELGALPLARRVRSRLRGLRVPVPRGPMASTRANPEGLTRRQVEVLRLVSDGRTNAEIAEELVLSVRTVDTHVAAVLAKLGVSSRQDAARRAAELGVADDIGGSRSR